MAVRFRRIGTAQCVGLQRLDFGALLGAEGDLAGIVWNRRQHADGSVVPAFEPTVPCRTQKRPDVNGPLSQGKPDHTVKGR